MHGYLQKLSEAQGTFTRNKRWFVLRGNTLFFYKAKVVRLWIITQDSMLTLLYYIILYFGTCIILLSRIVNGILSRNTIGKTITIFISVKSAGDLN